jgi:hypothetical protein
MAAETKPESAPAPETASGGGASVLALEGDMRELGAQLDDLEHQLRKQKHLFELQVKRNGVELPPPSPHELATAAATVARAVSAGSLDDIDAKIAAAKEEMAARLKRQDEAKAEFKSMKASLEKTSEHLAKAEVYAVRTPNLGGVEPPQ